MNAEGTKNAKLTAILLVAGMILPALILGAGKADAAIEDELIFEDTFDDGNLDGWVVSTWNPSTYTMEFVSTNAYSAPYALHLQSDPYTNTGPWMKKDLAQSYENIDAKIMIRLPTKAQEYDRFELLRLGGDDYFLTVVLENDNYGIDVKESYNNGQWYSQVIGTDIAMVSAENWFEVGISIRGSAYTITLNDMPIHIGVTALDSQINYVLLGDVGGGGGIWGDVYYDDLLITAPEFVVPVPEYYALNFHNAHVELDDSQTLGLAGGPFTIESWIKPNLNYNWQSIMAKGSNYAFGIDSNGKLFFYGGGIQYSTMTVDYGEWNHVAVTYNGVNNLRLYVNGQEEIYFKSFPIQASPTNTYTPTYIGDYYAPGTIPFDGVIDELRVLDRVLTAVEITQDHEGSIYTPKPLNTLLWMQFEEGTGSATYSTQYNFYGQIFGATWVDGVSSPQINVITPNGGEAYEQGSTQTITWDSDNIGSVILDLYKGGVFNSFIAVVAAEDGTYDWTIPAGQELGADYTIRITRLADENDYDESDVIFSITAPPSITDVSPANNIVLERGGTYEITWGSNGVDTVEINLDYGVTHDRLEIDIPNTGSWTWYIDPTHIMTGTGFHIEVVSSADSQVKGVSAGSITIIDPVNTYAIETYGDRINVPSAPEQDITGALTLEAWVNPANSQPDYSFIISKGGNYNLGMTPTGELFFWSYEGYASIFEISNMAIPWNEWTHVAVTYNGANTLTFYINGVADVRNVIPAHSLSAMVDLTIGGWDVTNYRFNGQLDEVRVLGQRLTANEILLDSQMNTYVPKLNTVAWFHFEDAAGVYQSAEDSSPYANHGICEGDIKSVAKEF